MKVTKVTVEAVKRYIGEKTRNIVKVDFEVKFSVGRESLSEIHFEYVNNNDEDAAFLSALLWASERFKTIAEIAAPAKQARNDICGRAK